LIQGGFNFPFCDDVLCPVAKIFNSKELREIGDTVNIGSEGDWIFFQIGKVCFWLKKIDGRFPTMDQFTRNIDGHSWLHIDPTDAAFLQERLDALPGKDGKDDPVFVRLDNGVAVRGCDMTKETATDLRLTQSRYEGSNVVMAVNRKYLRNALGFGIKRIGFNSADKSPLVCYGDERLFIAMPLEADEPKGVIGKVTVLASNSVKASVPSKIEHHVKGDEPEPKALASRSVKPRVRSNGKSKGHVTVLDDALRLRNSLRETLGSVNTLIQSIKAQKQKDRLLKTTMDSLRKLSL